MLHELPLQASESQFEFKSTDCADDGARFKLMLELLVRFCSAAGLAGILAAVLEVFCVCFLIESLFGCQGKLLGRCVSATSVLYSHHMSS